MLMLHLAWLLPREADRDTGSCDSAPVVAGAWKTRDVSIASPGPVEGCSLKFPDLTQAFCLLTTSSLRACVS